MNLFGNRGTRESGSTGGLFDAAENADGRVTHRLTLDLSRAHGLAAMVASSRASKFIEIPDLIAGIYIYEWDRLSEYWPEENRGQIESVLREMCKISPQRWNYWIQFYDSQKKGVMPASRWEKLKISRKPQPAEISPRHSAALRAIFEEAARITPFRDKNGGREVPILTTECVLLAVVRTSASDIAQKLRETRVDVTQLEKAALDPRRSPLR